MNTLRSLPVILAGLVLASAVLGQSEPAGIAGLQGREFLKLTEEIGKWGGDIAKAQLPDYFEVEYVRVYEITR